MQSLNNQIITTIKKKGRGKIIFTKDFSLLGTEFAIRLRQYAGRYATPADSAVLIGKLTEKLSDVK